MDNVNRVEQGRLELIAAREQRLQQLVQDREQLAKHVFALTKVSGSLARVPALSDVDEEQFRQFMDAFPLTTDTPVPMGSFTLETLPSEEFLLGATYAAAMALSNPQIPSVKVEEYDDNEDDKDDEQMDVDPNQEFNSKSRLKINLAKFMREESKKGRASLFESIYASALPSPPANLLTEDLDRLLMAGTQGLKGSQGDGPMDFSRWQATLTHNPTYKLVRKASKCLTSSEWSTSIQELILVRAFERIDELRNANLWSFRQPKRQVVPPVKDHWSYLLDEAKWMQADFKEERKWKRALALEIAEAVVEWHQADPDEREALKGYYRAPDLGEVIEPIERGVPPADEAAESPKQSNQKPSPPNESDEEDEVQAAIEPQEDIPMVDSPEAKPAQIESTQEPEFTMKTEDPESFSLHNADDEDKGAKPSADDLDDSKNPVLFALTSTPQAKPVLDGLVEIRDPIMDLDSDSLWVNPIELQSSVREGELNSSIAQKFELEFREHGWDAILSELPTYEIPSPPDVEARKIVARDDEIPHKTIPISRYADSQPLLLGALQPSSRLRNGQWHFYDDMPVTAEEGQRPAAAIALQEKQKRYSPSTAYKISTSVPRSPTWFSSEDTLLKRLVPELQHNWRLVAETFNFYNHSNPMEIRTAAHCFVRWDFYWGEQGNSMDGDMSMESMEGDAFVKFTTIKHTRDNSAPRKPKVIEDFVPTAAPSDDDPKFMRHKFVHRAIKRVMKRREEEVKAREVPHRLMVPHQSHEPIMKIKPLTPQELGRIKRDQEDKRIMEMTKRRQLEMRHNETRLRAMQGQQVGMHGVLPNGAGQMQGVNGLGNPSLNGGPVPLAMRVPGAVPNISQQANANMMAAVQRGANGEIITPMNSAVMLLQQQQAQQQQQQRMAVAAAMANGTPPRPQSASSMLSQAQMGNNSPQNQAQAQMLAARQAAMQDPVLRAQLQMQMNQMSGLQGDPMAMYRQQQQLQQAAQAQAQAQVRAQQMAAAGMQQSQNPPSSN